MSHQARAQCDDCGAEIPGHAYQLTFAHRHSGASDGLPKQHDLCREHYEKRDRRHIELLRQIREEAK